MSDPIIGEVPFREKPDISSVFIRQIDRTNHSATLSDDPYRASINQILAILPIRWRNWVYEQTDRFEVTEPMLIYKKFSGVRMGSQNEPMLLDEKIPVMRFEDGSVNWNDPNIISPILQEVTEIDYQRFNEVVMEAAELAGLTWRTDPLEQDAGDTEEYIIERKATPFQPQKLQDT